MSWWKKLQGKSGVAGTPKEAGREAAAARDVKSLLIALKDPSADVRRDAAYTLAKLSDQASVEGLIAALKDADIGVRMAASRALSFLGDTRAVPCLTECLNDPSIEGAYLLRREIAESLVKLRAEFALEKALADPDSRVRRIAAEGLESLGIKPIGDAACVLRAIALERWDEIAEMGEIALDPLARALGDESNDVAKGAAKTLAKIRSERVVPPLAGALKDRRDGIRQRAAWALAATGKDEALAALVAALSRADESHVYDSIVNAVAEFHERALAPLLALLRSKANDGNTTLFIYLPKALGSLGPSTIPDLISYLSDSDPALRKAIARALGIARDIRAVEPLTRLLADAQTGVRIEALGALQRLRSRASSESILPLLLDTNENVRLASIEALEDIGDSRAGASLVPLLQDPVASVRWYAAKALGILHEKTSVEPLCAALADSEPLVRTLAAEALGKLGDARAVEALEAALEKFAKTDGHFRRAAEAALGALPRSPKSRAQLEAEKGPVGELDKLVKKLVDVYRAHPEGFVKDGGHSEELNIRKIGETFYAAGGIDSMRAAHRDFVSKTGEIRGAGRNLEMLWDGIGSWRG